MKNSNTKIRSFSLHIGIDSPTAEFLTACYNVTRGYPTGKTMPLAVVTST